MHTLDEVGTSIKDGIPEILADLQASCEREPWCSLPPEERLNNLAQVTRGLVDVALGTRVDSQTKLEEVYAAAEHGEHRLKMGFDQSLIFTEFTLLRHALWRFLRTHAPSALGQQASVRLDAAMTLATLAALRGYHRPLIESRGEWPHTLDQLVENWPT